MDINREGGHRVNTNTTMEAGGRRRASRGCELRVYTSDAIIAIVTDTQYCLIVQQVLT